MMDTPSAKPDVATSVATQPSRPVSPTPPKPRRLKRKIAGVLVLLLAIAFSLYANFATVQKIIGLGDTVSPTPHQIAVANTPTPTVFAELTVINTPPFADTRTWLIKPDTSFFSTGDMPKTGVKGRKDVTATLYSPVEQGTYLCRYDDAESIFLEKKADAGWTRLCDKEAPTATPHVLRCEPYNPTTGIRIAATFYPVSACKQGGVITAGEYQVHAKIYTNCEVDGMRNGDSCEGIVDVVSSRITVTQ